MEIRPDMGAVFYEFFNAIKKQGLKHRPKGRKESQ